MPKAHTTHSHKPCPFLGKACTILHGPNRGRSGKVIEYDRLANEFTIAISLSDDRVVWVWEPRHNTDLIKFQIAKYAS